MEVQGRDRHYEEVRPFGKNLYIGIHKLEPQKLVLFYAEKKKKERQTKSQRTQTNKQINKKRRKKKEKNNFLSHLSFVLFSFLFPVFIYAVATLFLLVTFVPPLMDVIVPLNESRRMKLPVLGEYFVDEDKYFYLMYFHMALSIMINVTVFVATDTQLMIFCCHVSGIFSVVG